jgi:hypothetical protein
MPVPALDANWCMFLIQGYIKNLMNFALGAGSFLQMQIIGNKGMSAMRGVVK